MYIIQKNRNDTTKRATIVAISLLAKNSLQPISHPPLPAHIGTHGPKSIFQTGATLLASRLPIAQCLAESPSALACRRLPSPPPGAALRTQLPAASARPLGVRRLRPRAQDAPRSRLEHTQGPGFGRLPRAPSRRSRTGPQGAGLPCCTGPPRTCTRAQGRAGSQPEK